MTTTKTPEGIRQTHEIHPNESAHAICHVSEPIISILNDYGRRHSQVLALYGGLYAMGCALASLQASLDPAADLRMQLEPLFDGYEAMRKEKAH